MKKRILCMVLAALMVLSLMPMTVFATGTTYAITNGTPKSDAEKNHGYITIDKETAAEGDTVTVTVKPADGYKLKSLTAVPAVPTFKAVYNTAGGANTLTFYYDAEDHSGDNITVYEDGTANFLFDDTKSSGAKWGYNDIRENVKSVIIDSSVANYTGLTSTAYMFSDMYGAESISGAEYLDVSNVTDMNNMFSYYGFSFDKLNAVPDVSKWNTGNVTDMLEMFRYYGYCSTGLTAVPDVSGWNTGNVTNMSNMFNSYGNNSTVLTAVPSVSGWNTGNVTDMSYMFNSYGYNSTVLTAVPNVSGWNTGNVTDMSYMFNSYGYNSTVLNAVPSVSGWNTGNVTDMSNLFYYYGSSSTVLTAVPDVSKWNTGNVINMSSLFNSYGTTSTVLNFTLDLSKWSVAKVTSYSYMFSYAGKKATTWSVIIPAKTGEQANETTKWYVGDGTDTGKYIAPAGGRTFTLAAPAISKVEDVLATVEGSFPTSKDNAWKNGEINSCYKSGDNLHLQSGKPTFDLPLTTTVSGSGDGFTCTYNSATFTFNMEEGKLTSIKVEGTASGFLDGTYAPAAPAPEIKTVADVLATVAGGFPTSSIYSEVPSSPWINGNLIRCFRTTYASMDILLYGAGYILATNPVTKSGDNYVYTYDGVTYTFNMTGGVLTSIVISNSYSETVDGTYAPAETKTVAEILPDDFPVRTSEEIPSNAWKNTTTTSKSYVLNSSLYFGTGSIPLNLELVKIEDGKYTYNNELIFIMESDKLVQIVVSGFSEKNNGTYAPASKLLKSSPAKSLKSTPAEPEVKFVLQTDGTYQFKMPAYAVVITAEFEKAHTHNLVKVNGQAATEEAAGWKDYYECDCGKYYEDAYAKVEITDLNAWKAVNGNGYIAPLPHIPETGDNGQIALWIMLLALSSVGFYACFTLCKKKRSSK